MALFFEQQAKARSNSVQLIFIFLVSVAAVVLAVVLCAIPVARHFQGVLGPASPEQAALGLGVFTLLAILVGSFYRFTQIGESGAAVAKLLGGRPVLGFTVDPLERRLIDVVEEMAIASGIAVPKIFVQNSEKGINAFATGRTPSEAVIVMTRGALETLSRDELQGMVAHEFSHIFNGDMRLNLRLMVVLGGLLAPTSLGHGFLTRPNAQSVPLPSQAMGFCLRGVGWFGVIVSRLIKAVISQQREYLADAAALRCTRNPHGIGGSLFKILQHVEGSVLRSPLAEEASHMFFAESIEAGWLKTHPPLRERIRRVAPQFLSGEWTPQDPLDDTAVIMALARKPTQGSRKAADVIERIGLPTADDVTAARAVLGSMGTEIQDQARSTDGSPDVILALLLDESSDLDKQSSIIRAAVGAQRFEGVLRHRELMGSNFAGNRLQILRLALSGFRALESTQQRNFLVLVRELCLLDGKLNLFECVTIAMLESQLSSSRGRPVRAPLGANQLPRDLSVLVSALSYAGSSNVKLAKVAFDCGFAALGGQFDRGVRFLPPDECQSEFVLAVLKRLRDLSGEKHQRIVEACVAVILSDSTVTTGETELLSAVCMVLEAPLPVLAAEVSTISA